MSQVNMDTGSSQSPIRDLVFYDLFRCALAGMGAMDYPERGVYLAVRAARAAVAQLKLEGVLS
jgi:hypothetical protein